MAGERIAALHAALGEAVLAQIHGAIRTTWLPIEVDVALAEAVESTCGPNSDYERARQSLLESMERSFLRPFVEGVRKVFGLSPKGLLKTCQRAWGGLYRDCGEPRFLDLAVNSAALDFRSMPAAMLESAVYLRAIAGALHALLDLCHTEGQIEVEAVDRERRAVRFVVTWH